MPTLTKLSVKKRRRGLTFAELLRCAAAAAPDDELKREVLRLAGSVEQRFGFSDAEKKEAVMAMILDGAQTLNDLLVETGFRKQDLDEAIRTLEADGRIRISRQQIYGNGRPTNLFIPIDAENDGRG